MLALGAMIMVAALPADLDGQDPRPAPPTDVPAVPASPSEPGDFDGGDPVLSLVEELVWTAGALREVLSERDYPAVVVLSSLNRVLQDDDGSVLDGLGPLMTALAIGPGAPSRVERCRTADDPVEGALCAVEELMPLAPPSIAREMAEESARLLSGYLRPGEPAWMGARPGMVGAGTRASGELSAVLDPFQRFAEEALEDALRVRVGGVDRIEGFTSAFDGLLAGAVGFSPRDEVEEILARVPDLQSLIGTHQILASLGESARSAESVVGEYHSFLGTLTGTISQVLDGLPRGEGLGATLGPETEPHQLSAFDWASQRSFVYLAARSAGLSGLDQRASDRLRAVGNAAVDLQGGAFRFSENVVGMGREMAMAALSGNVLTMAATLTAFFDATPGALGPNAGREVRALREGVETLRTELHTRLDDVDGRLDEVLEVVDTRFGRLEQLVVSSGAAVQLEIRALHEGMLALGERLDHMEENLHSYIQAGFDRDYSRTLIRCLEHRERYLPPFDRMEFALFSECLADFRARAVQDARDALLVDQTTPVDDLSLAQALSDPSLYNLARRLPLLGRAAEQRFAYGGLRGGRNLANPVEWAVASQAYLTLLRDWPEHARGVAPGDLEAMRSAGVELRAALRGMTVDPSTGSRGTLMERVLEYYEERVTELTADADVLARRHQQSELLRVPPGSLLNRLTPADPGDVVLEVPPAIYGSVPQEVRTAAVLALGEVSLVYRVSFEDRVERRNFRRSFPFLGRRHDRITHTRAHVEIDLRFGSLGALATHRVAGPFVLRRTEEMAGDATSERVVQSREHLPDPRNHFVTEIWPDLASDPNGAWEISPARPLAMQTLENAIEAELRRHASVALNGVFTAVCEEGPVGAELSAADRESALRIRSALDGLTASRSLLEAYVNLALPFSAENDGDLREALYGPDAILDRAALCRVVALGESPLRLVWLEEEPRRRMAALGDILADALAREAAAPEPLPLVESTLEQIEAAIRVQRLRTLVARADL